MSPYDVPDQQLNDPRQDEEMTPEQALDDGDVAMCDEFFAYMIAHERQELYDFIMAKADDVVMRANIKRWSEKVQRGEL